jgi:hypothetical protein
MRVYIYTVQNKNDHRRLRVRGSNMKNLFKHISRLLNEGNFEDVIISGGRIGTWWYDE